MPAPRHDAGRKPSLYAMLVRLLWCCGLRIGEALSLRVSDVDLAESVITVHKAKHNRTRLVPMSESLAAHARRYTAAIGLVPEDREAWSTGSHLLEGATTANWPQALGALALTYPDRINQYL